MQVIRNFWASLDAVGRTVAIVTAGVLMLAIILTNYDITWVMSLFGF